METFLLIGNILGLLIKGFVIIYLVCLAINAHTILDSINKSLDRIESKLNRIEKGKK